MAGKIITTGPRPVASMPMAVAPQIQQAITTQRELLRRAGDRIQLLEGENASLATRLSHVTAVMICLLQSHECFKVDARFPMELLEEMERERCMGLGLDTGRDDTTKELVIKIMTLAESQARVAGFMTGAQEQQIPKKPPFRIKVEVPPGARFYGIASVVYVGGKSDGKALEYTPNRPKKPREFTVSEEENGDILVHFTTDSAGLTIRVIFTFRVPIEAIPSEGAKEGPLEYQDEECKNWHTHENDGKIIGRYCPVCGDSRKVLQEQAS